MDTSTQLPPRKSKRKAKILHALRTAVVGIVILGLLAIEFGTNSSAVRYVFYGMISVYLISIGLRAFKFRKHILYHFAPGTKESLGPDFQRADELLKKELNRLAEGYEIGFVKAFANEFRQIDKSARSEPTKLDKVLDFVEYAFPFQSNLISIVSKPLKGITNKRSFRVSIAKAQDGSISLNAFSQNELTHDIHVDEKDLESCLQETGCRMFHEMHASELTQSYAAFRNYNRAFLLWERIHQDGIDDSQEFEDVAQHFRQALAEDPDFILAALYLGAMNAYRRTAQTYLERSKKRLNEIIARCDQDSFPAPKAHRAKYKGLASALLCFVNNQWLHRMGKYDDEEQAILISKDNQQKAAHAVKLLKNSPIAIHQYAFSLHSLEQIALENPQAPEQITRNYALAYEQYTLAISTATQKRMPANVNLSSGNRAYVSMWLGAMLLKTPEQHIKLSAFGRNPLLHATAADKLWSEAEKDMKQVYSSSNGATESFAIANLCLLYALMGRFQEIPYCGHLLIGTEKANDPQPYTIKQIGTLSSQDFKYLEGANDLATGLLTACACGTLSSEEHEIWLKKGIEFQKRSFDLIQVKESQNVGTQRIRLVKQITNLLKVIHYTNADASGRTENIFKSLSKTLDTIRNEQETTSSFSQRWLQELEKTLSAKNT